MLIIFQSIKLHIFVYSVRASPDMESSKQDERHRECVTITQEPSPSYHTHSLRINLPPTTCATGSLDTIIYH